MNQLVSENFIFIKARGKFCTVLFCTESIVIRETSVPIIVTTFEGFRTYPRQWSRLVFLL